MIDLLQKRTVVSRAVAPTGANGYIDFTSTGDKFILTPAMPLDVYKVGIIWATAKDATAFAVTLDKRVTIGSDTGRVTLGTISDAAARAAAAVVYQEPGSLATTAATQSTAEDGTLRNVDPVGVYRIVPGQELVIAVTDASVSGTGVVFIEYAEQPFAGSDVASAVKITATT